MISLATFTQHGECARNTTAIERGRMGWPVQSRGQSNAKTALSVETDTELERLTVAAAVSREKLAWSINSLSQLRSTTTATRAS